MAPTMLEPSEVKRDSNKVMLLKSETMVMGNETKGLMVSSLLVWSEGMTE
jgi:hypothetical protein